MIKSGLFIHLFTLLIILSSYQLLKAAPYIIENNAVSYTKNGYKWVRATENLGTDVNNVLNSTSVIHEKYRHFSDGSAAHLTSPLLTGGPIPVPAGRIRHDMDLPEVINYQYLIDFTDRRVDDIYLSEIARIEEMMFEGYDPEIFSHSQAGNVSGHHSSEKPISPKASSESDGLSQLPASYPGEENQKKFRADRLVYEEDDSPPPSGLTYLFKAIDLSQRFLAWTHSFLFSWQSSSDANQFSETD